MASGRIQPFCRNYYINIVFFKGKEITPRTITEGNKTLVMHNNQFCLIWKSQNISFNQAIKDELKQNFKIVDDVISDKHVKIR